MLRTVILACSASLLAAACSPDDQPGALEPADNGGGAGMADPGPFDRGELPTPDEAGGPISREFEALLPLRGIGQEPGWHVRVERDSTTIYRQSEALVSFPTRQPDIAEARFRLDDPDGPAHVVFSRQLCRDVTTGMPHPYTVAADTGAQTLHGCGGDPETLFADANWTLALLGDEPLDSDRELSIRFEDGRVSGASGCNRFTGSYTLTGESLTLTGLASTEMACPGDGVMEQETRILERLSQVSMFDLTDEGALILRTGLGETITAWRTE